MKKIAPLLVIMFCAAASVPVLALDIYVSAAGDDANSGAENSPLKTLEAARNLARAKAGKVPLTVTVLDGTYYLEQTLTLTGEDSGSAAAPVVYRAAHEGKAVLSGGMRLDLRWEPRGNGIFQARTPDGLRLDQLFVNGARQMMARYPNYDPQKTSVPYRGAAADALSPERVAAWGNPAGGFIHAMHAQLWGGFDYLIAGKNADGELIYEGGWQNNRPSPMHPEFRMVENIFEELDAPGEWFHQRETNTLYFRPPDGLDLSRATVEGVRLASLLELKGTRERPVRFVTFDGFTLRHASRTFMLNKEPLLRSDWTLYRGGAVLFSNTEDCRLLNCFIDQPGGNAVFVNHYNRRALISGLHVFDCGASAVVFAGDIKAVRSPLFGYNAPHNLAATDRTPGPLTDNYPMDCAVEDSLLHEVGTVEKQGAGVQISMSRRVTVRHCSIYDTSRAGININEGTWGGHVIEDCDIFNTVQETGDHGSFNSWGRDRYWHVRAGAVVEAVAKEPALPFLDAVETNVLRHNRWRCDHGWDIDLDDGSSNYVITDNLLLRGGLKLREGYRRIVTNNIIVNNSLHPHVWFPNSGDVFTGNIVTGAYRPAAMRLTQWGADIDRNLFASNHRDRTRFAAHGADAHSVVGDPQFADPAKGDFTVRNEPLAREIGFKNFSMNNFGVQKPSLKVIAKTPTMPAVNLQIDLAPAPAPTPTPPPSAVLLGATCGEPTGEEMSAYGVSFDTRGVAIEQIEADSPLGGADGLRKGDLILELNGGKTGSVAELRKAFQSVRYGKLSFRVIRAQQEMKLDLTLSGEAKP